MGLQQIGGTNVYVITGSSRDPRKTSNGQSWADLVTSQKWMLIQQAQKDAMRQIDREYADYQSRQKAYAQAQEDIRKQIDNARKEVTNIKLKEAQAQTGLEKTTLQAEQKRSQGEKVTTRIGGGGSGRGGTGGMSENKFQADLTNQINANQQIATKGMELGSDRTEQAQLRRLIQSKKADMYNDPFYEQLDENTKSMIDGAQAAQERVNQLNQIRAEFSQATTPEAKRNIIDKYEGKAPSSGGGTGGSSTTITKYKGQTELPETPIVDYTALTAPLEERIKSLEQELVDMKSPTAPTTDESNLMRQYATERYGLRSAYRPPEKQAEMDALGVEPQPVVQTQPVAQTQPIEEPVFQPSTVENVTPVEPVQEEVVQPYLRPQEEVVNPRITPSIDTVELTPQQFETLPTVQPKPISTPIGDKLRETYPTATPAPAPTPLPTQPVGRIEDIFNRLMEAQKPKETSLDAIFEPVKFGTEQQKKEAALQFLMQKAQEMGVSNPAYLKLKDKVIEQLTRTLDPKKFKQIKLVEKNQSKNRGDYFGLASAVGGLKEQNANLVYSLFPINEQTKASEADALYKNAQKQIDTNISDSVQRKKSREFLDLMYLAYMQEK